jgi:hypothetical protein
MRTAKKRIRLSFLVAETQKLLFWVLVGFALLLFGIYLFWMNRIAMQGYVLTKFSEKNAELSSTIEQLEARIARFETREYVAKRSESVNMVVRGRQHFVVVKKTLTAQK